jgi:hypothetical protein
MDRKTPSNVVRAPSVAITRAAALKTLGDDPDGKDAVVTETKTKTYREPAPKTDEKNKQNQTGNSNENNKVSAFAFETKTNVPTNKLAILFQDMAEYEEEDGEIFYALLIRRPDLMSDNFRKPCLSPQNFQPLQVSSKMMLQFIPMIQKYNGNSGGRFDIVICDTNGESLEIGISGYTVPDPLLEDVVQINGNAVPGGLGDLINLFREEQKANRDVMIKLLEGKEDEFTKIAKEKLRNDILNPPQPQQQQGFDMTTTMQQVMSSVAVTQAMAGGFAKMFNTGGEREKGLLESLLGNEMLVGKAQEIYEHTTSLLADVVLAKTNPAEYVRQQQVNNPTGFSGEESYPPLQQAQSPTEDQEKAMARQEVIAKILTELESDSVLDDKNSIFIELKEQYPEIYDTVMLSCKSLPFDVLVSALETLAPDVFVQYYKSPGVPNEKGTYVVTRLKEFTEFLRTQK